MNQSPNAPGLKRQGILRFVSVYGLLPLLSLLLCLLIVFLQFTNSRVVFPEESLPLFHQLSLMASAAQSLPEAEDQEAGAILLSHMDLPTETLQTLAEIPVGVYPIQETVISNTVGIINATDLSVDLSVQAAALPAVPAGEGPTVLVVHTHATESYYDPAASPVSGIVAGQSEDVFGYYEEGLSPRSTDNTQNVVEVGRVFCETLESMGISTVHCQTQHDLDYSQAYANSLDSIESYLREYPSIRYIIDLHRDSLVRESGTKLKPTVVINGEKVAQVMLVVGAGSSDLAQPNWKENFAMSARYQSYLGEISSDFTRPLYLRYGRFNQHISAGTMLLEVGSCGNTLEEAVRAGKYAATSLGNMILAAA